MHQGRRGLGGHPRHHQQPADAARGRHHERTERKRTRIVHPRQPLFLRGAAAHLRADTNGTAHQPGGKGGDGFPRDRVTSVFGTGRQRTSGRRKRIRPQQCAERVCVAYVSDATASLESRCFVFAHGQRSLLSFLCSWIFFFFFLSCFCFFSLCRSMGAWLFLDKDAVRSTCATKGEVLKFILWVSPTGGGALRHAGTATCCVTPNSGAPRRLLQQ